MIRNNQNRRRRGGNGPRPQQMNGGGNYGNRLDNRQRGNASQLLEKYRALARDAQQAGDRVTAEYYLQYADHYYRVLGDYRDKSPDQGRQRGRDFYDDDNNGYAAGGDEAESANDDYEGGDRGDERGDDRDDGRIEARSEPRGDENRGNWRDDRSQLREPRREGNRDGNREPRRDFEPREPRREPEAREPRREAEAREPRRDNDNRPPRREGERAPWNGGNANREPGSDRGERPDRRERRPEPARIAEPVIIDEGPIPGLPGPATLRVASAAAIEAPPLVLSAESEAPPAPRKRGRPRKVVSETPVEG